MKNRNPYLFSSRMAAICCSVVWSVAATFSTHAATYTVINTNDSGAGSLRWAISSTLTSTPPNEINFNIPGPGPHTIKVVDMLPWVTNAVSILGNTQPGYTGTPVVTILGPATNFFDYGLNLSVTGTLVRGLRISGFTQVDYGTGITMNGGQIAACVLDGNFNGVIAQGGTVGGTTTNDRNIIINNVNGIWMITGSTATVRGNFIGVEADGVTPAGNENGIRTFFAGGLTFEGHPNYPQVISGNKNAGILLGPNGGYVHFSSANTIRGNHIGTDITGMIAVSNKIGIWSWGGGGNIIGGTSVEHRNIISGNNGTGVLIEGLWLGGDLSSYNNVVRGNYIGVASDGATPLKNSIGVHILNGRNNVIGGTSAGQGNRFGVADYYNVYISATPTVACYSNVVQGNSFGLTTGVVADVLYGSQAGIRISASSNNLIGGNITAARNYISGAGAGVSVDGTNSRNNRIIGNYIGVGPSGQLYPNNSYGVHLFHAPRNQIGGVYTNEGNVISGNQYSGVFIQGTGSYANVIQGNRIGADPTATFSVSNRYSGIDISSGAFSNIIGGADAGTANVIAGNGGSGVSIRDMNTYGNVVQNNFIGMNRSYQAITNGSYGVEIFQASSNLIGGGNYIGNCRSPAAGIRVSGTNAFDNIIFSNVVGMDNAGNRHPNYGGIDVADARNTIVGFSLFTANFVSGNFADGISVRGVASNTQVRFNYVGTDLSGNSVVKNDGTGVRISAPYNSVGGTNFGNVISGNSFAGIFIDSGGTNTIVQGNYVGTDASGTYALTNGGAGVRVDAHGVLVGGSVPGARNIISGNNFEGVAVLNGAKDVTIQGNYIGLNWAGDVAITNRQIGIRVSGATNTVIGGAGLARNVIAANRFHGVFVTENSSNTVIAGNYIGLSANGLTAIGNIGPGITVNAGNTMVGIPIAGYGNYIAGNTGAGILVSSGSVTRIRNNFIGLGANGITNIPNNQGIHLNEAAQGAEIGGTNALDRNVIARNTGTELAITGPSGNHTIRGNMIGVQEFGIPFPTVNGGRGIEVVNSPGNRILGNVIGQVAEALYLSGTGTLASLVQGNFIGEYQLEPITNSSWGITITNAQNNIVGGFTTEERNLITRNNGGILVTGAAAVNNDVARNLIYGNSSRLNIDIGTLGFNADDPLDSDEGANRLQNRPRVTGGYTVSPSLFVYAQGVLTSAPLTTYAIDVFRSQGTNASAFRYLGRTFTTTDGAGVGAFTAGFPSILPAGEYLSATATDPDGNTSELAASASGIAAATNLDSDDDGIPDYWETLYGLNPAVSNSPAADFDNDGFSDYEEYLADTPANDGDAFPVITWIAGETNHYVSFPSSSVRVYSLHANESLDTGVWSQVGGIVTGTFGWTTMVDTNSLEWRNYRFSVRLP